MHSRKLLLPILLALALSGCAKQVITNLPPGVTQAQVNAWTSATQQLKIVSDSVHSGTTVLIQLNRSGVFPDGPKYKAAVQALANIKKAELTGDAVLAAAPNNFGQPIAVQITGVASTIITELANLTNATAGVPAQSIALLSNSIAAMQLAAKTIADLKGTP